jgi:electron transport complex protein RnfG
MLKMVIVLTAICGGSALVLSYANVATKERREYSILKYVQEPSIKAVLSGYDNDPIKDRIEMVMGKDEQGKPVKEFIFPAKKGGAFVAVAYSEAATGYHGPIEVMVGIRMDGSLSGISVMTHSETPGLGARVVEPGFTKQFEGLTLSPQLNLSGAGGSVDAVSGATTSSKGVVKAVRQALETFPKVKQEVS